jgi:hypothetical protein
MRRRLRSNTVQVDVGDDARKLAAELQDTRSQQFLDSSLPESPYEQRKFAQAKGLHDDAIKQDQPADKHTKVDRGQLLARTNCNFA